MQHLYTNSFTKLQETRRNNLWLLVFSFFLLLGFSGQIVLPASAYAGTSRAVAVDNHYCAASANGDYGYNVTTTADRKLNFSFVPLAPIAQSNLALLYTRPGTSGGWTGHPQMVKEGDAFKLSIDAPADGSVISFYFTYSAAPQPGERNSMANPHVYTVGTTCSAAGNAAPTISLSVPAGPFTAPASIMLTASASDTDGSIAMVEFFNGSTLLGTDNAAPFAFEWTGVAPGSYVITAKATDNGNMTTTSSPVVVQVKVAPGQPNAQYCGVSANGDYAYDVNTSNNKVNITFVPLAPISESNMALIYTRPGTSGGWMGHPPMTKDGNVFKIALDAPAAGSIMSFYFTYSAAPQPGERNSQETPHAYTVGTSCGTATGTAPTVSLSAPAGPFTAPATILLTATAADADGTVALVEFFSGATLLGSDNTAPFTFNWTGVATGNYSVTAKATDNSGLATTSSAVAISVTTSGGTADPAYCGVSANGDYGYDVATLDGKLNFTFVPLEPIAQSNLALLYTRAGTSGGWTGHPQMVKEGNVFKLSIDAPANGSVISFYFTYSAAPQPGERNSMANPHVYTVGTTCGSTSNTGPTVTLTAPAGPFTAPATILLQANASDATGTITMVEFLNGTTVLGTDNTAPYSFEWAAVAAGTYSVTAKATNSGGLSTTSDVVVVTVSGASNSPYCGTSANGDYAYNISTADGKLNFTFFPLEPIAQSNLALLYTRAGTSGGWTGHPQMVKEGNAFKLSINAPANGSVISFYFTYSAAPQPGERNSMDNPHIYVVGTSCGTAANAAPTVTLTPPTGPFAAPATILLQANASDTDGTVTKVEFYNGDNLLGTDLTAPYSFEWTNVAAGTYSVTARATDNANAITTSGAVSVTVTGGQPPVVCGTSANGDYSYNVTTTSDAKLNFTFIPLAPIAQSDLALLYTRPGTSGGWVGHPRMVKEGGVFKLSIDAPANGSVTSFYFTYSAAPQPGERNSMDNPHVYTVGTTCTQAANVAPVVAITSPANGARINGPADVVLTATATDADGTISKVEFYNGTTRLGEATLAAGVYSYTWAQATLGDYTLTARATDNNNVTSTSAAVTITVVDPNGIADDVLANNDFKVYPNPAVGELTISSSRLKGSSFMIMDMVGKTVYSGVVNDRSISLSDLPAGIYSVIVVKAGERMQRRFVKQ